MQLHNHAKSLSILGEKWVNKFIKDQYHVTDLTNAKGDSFVKRWYNLRDLKACDFHQIISPSTIIKLNKYLVDNQRFKVDKCTRQINGQITPTEECSEAWSEGWFVRVNVRELCHQLCSISFRTHSGSSYSKQHRNNLAFSELFKLFDWSIYSEEQCKIIQVSIAERELNKEHRRPWEEESFQSRITLAPDGTTGITTNETSKYNIEKCMPLVKTPRLDLYFNNRELTTLALLNCTCLEFLCKAMKNIAC